MVAARHPAGTKDEKTRAHLGIGLTNEVLLEMYHTMILSRAVDDRAWLLNRQGKAAFVVSAHGHEACQVGSAYALRRGYDYFLPYYRDTAVALAVGLPPQDLLLGILARVADPSSGGRQMPSHWSSPPLHIFTGSSPVATQIPQAAGVALAAKLRREDKVVIVYFGDGATSTGDFHEGLNFAGIHRLPVIFFCENNGYAISVPLAKQMAVASIAERARAYGFPGVQVDGNDILAVYQATYEAAERARAAGGPTLIEAKTYRLMPHSSNDDDRDYRSREEVESWAKKDPILRYHEYLMQAGVLSEAQDKALHEEVMKVVNEATDYAEASPLPGPEDLLTYVYAS